MMVVGLSITSSRCGLCDRTKDARTGQQLEWPKFGWMTKCLRAQNSHVTCKDSRYLNLNYIFICWNCLVAVALAIFAVEISIPLLIFFLNT
jgi:hypothetical protein